MPPDRMKREEFFVKLAPLDAEQRGKILWNLCWRGTAAVRERIEGELDPPEREAALPPRAREMRAERAAVQAQLAQAYQAGRISSD